MLHPALWAQEGLHINRVFGKPYRQQKDAVEVWVEGKQLKVYNLSLFRSLTLQPSSDMLQDIESAIIKDEQSAIEKEVGKIGGRIYYGFFRFADKDGSFRYLFYRNSALRHRTSKEVTVVYMEGKATWEELKKMFK